MSSVVGRLAPTLIVAAFVAWCVWPYLSGAGSGGLVAEPEEVPQIAASLLEPTMEPAGDRNPFRTGDADQPDPSQTATTEEEEPEAVKAAPVPELQPANLLEQLTLDATFIRGDQRLALISGQVCAQGDALSVSGLTTEPCIVARIDPHRVLIEFRGETLELGYRDSISRAAGPRTAPALDQTDPVPTETVVSGSERS